MIGRFTLIALIATGCAHASHTSRHMSLPAPNPSGCYVIVYDRADFKGVGDVFNGPGRWPRLERLMQTNAESWRNRIRSLDVGSAATVTAYIDEAFKGHSQRFSPSTHQPRLEARLSGRIESLEITCPAPVGGTGPSNHR
jgi:hypothetical protein